MDWENPEQVVQALFFLYAHQTQDERSDGVTKHDNRVGFNAIDAPILTDIARKTRRFGRISEKQFTLVQGRIRQYRGQWTEDDLAEIELPDNFHIYVPEDKENKTDGILGVWNGELLFKPNVYPSTQIKPLGFKWKEEYWRGYPSLEKIRKVQEMFPSTVMHETVQTWIADITKTEKIVDLPDDLFAYQAESVGWMKSHTRGLLALAPGLGKTRCALEAAGILKGSILIVCPLSLARNWQQEIRKWTGRESVIWRQRIGNDHPGIVITNYETIRTQWVSWEEKLRANKGKRSKKPVKIRVNWQSLVEHDFDTLIIDESIFIKNRKAIRSNALFTIAPTFNNVWLLSGSPTSRYLDDLYYQFKTLYPRRFTSYWKFTEEYCHIEKGFWGWKIIDNKDGAEKQLLHDMQDIYFARTQDQVLNLPTWIFEQYDIDMHPSQNKMYIEIEETMRAMLPDGDVLVAPNILAKITRLIQIASNPILVGGNNKGAKWDALDEIIEFTAPPHIIWIGYKQTARAIMSKFRSKKIALFTGDTPEPDRQPIINRLQSGDLDILVAHPGVGKYGHTMTTANTSVYLERIYDSDAYYQSIHRVRRIGTRTRPHVIHLRAMRKDGKPTIDHVIHRVLSHRKENSLKITSGLIREVLDAQTVH